MRQDKLPTLEENFNYSQALSYLLLLISIVMENVADVKLTEEKVHCVFIHGAGTIPDDLQARVQTDVQNLPQDLKDYWGDVTKWTETKSRDNPRSVCTSYAFTYLDTVHNPWNDESLADAACEALMDEKTHFDEGKTQKQRIFLHSMGNLIFYNALHLGKCAINEYQENTNVYSLAGPFQGSNMVNVAKQICAKDQKQFLENIYKDETWSKILKGIEFVLETANGALKWFSGMEKPPQTVDYPDDSIDHLRELAKTICNLETGDASTSFESLGWLNLNSSPESVASFVYDARMPSSHEIEHVLQLSQKYTKGGICGFGIGDFSGESYPMTMLMSGVKGFLDSANKTDHHDGVVPLESCIAASPNAKWNTDSTSTFWLVNNNHNAITGRYGDPEILYILERLD